MDQVFAGPVMFDAKDAPRVLPAFQEFISEAPRELGAFFGYQIVPPGSRDFRRSFT